MNSKLLDHVFLPSKIDLEVEQTTEKDEKSKPKKKDKSSNKEFSNKIQDLLKLKNQSEDLSSPIFTLLHETLINWSTILPQTYKLFQNSLPLYESAYFEDEALFNLINNKKDLIIHWTAQNSTILLKFLEENQIKIYLYPQSNIPEELLHQGNNIQVQLPLNCFTVSLEQVNVELLVSQIVSLEHKNDTFQQNVRKSVEIDKIQNVVGDDNIRNWLIPSLNPQPTGFVQITKKIRDESLKSGNLSWRRCSMYLAVKQVLHHQVIEELDSKIGQYIYKFLILRFQLDLFSKVNIDELDYGLFSDIIVKMKNRIDKLKAYMSENQLKAYAKCEQNILSTEKRIVALFNNKKQLHHVPISNIPSVFPLKMPISIAQQFVNAKKYIDKLTEPTNWTFTSIVKQIELPDLPSEGNNESVSILLEQINKSTKETFYFKAWLAAVERAVNKWWLKNDLTHSVSELFNLFHAYKKSTEPIYSEDPVGVSCQYLTLTTICALIDKTILKRYPLFQEHRIDYALPSFENILLPEYAFMEQLHSLEEYYEERTNDELLPGILDVSEKSAATRYAMNNETICRQRGKILELDNRLQEMKTEELKNKTAEKEELASKIANYGAHDLYEAYNYRGNWVSRHDRYCKKCKLELALDNLSISRYERILPTAEWQQYFVVFNFFAGSDILQWRDCLYLVSQAFKKSGNTKKLFCWKRTFGHHYNSEFDGKKFEVQLSSTMNTFHSVYSSAIFLKSGNFDNLIVENGFNLALSVENKSLLNTEVKKFPIQKCTYGIMDPAFQHLSHVCRSIVKQNNVIAALDKCPEEITEAEWKAFASIREGTVLQYNNIYATVHSRSVPFERIGVVFLLMNALWQVGEPNGLVVRLAHDQLLRKQFVSALIDELDSFLAASADQWNKCHILINIALVAIRCFTIAESLCPHLKIKMITLLRKIREIGLSWIQKLALEVSKVLALQDIDETVIQELRDKLCFSSIAIIFTYYTDCSKLPSLLDSSEDYLSWISAINSLNDNHNSAAINSKNILFPFLCLVHRIALNCYPLLSRNSPLHLTAFINDLIRVNEANLPWVENNSTGAFTATGKKSDTHYEMNVLTGKLLIEGRPVNKLPACFITDQFIRIFGTTIFEASQRDKGSFITKCSYSNSKFAFSVIGKSDYMIRSIDNKTGDELILIDHMQLSSDLPQFFVRQFSHWLDSKNGIIYLKPILFKDKSFFNLEKVRYLLTCENKIWRFYDKKSEKYLLDYYSEGFTVITTSILRNLEDKSSFHCWYDFNEPEEVDIELPRYDLSFVLSLKNTRIYYNSMIVSENQSLGTLLGLENYVKLASEKDQTDQIIIVPHGSVKIEKSTKINAHQSVQIATSILSDPPFFTYRVNKDLCRLDGPDRQEAWLYLAYLHACTSSIFRDDFTNTTGTEEAIRILQLPICQSLQPYNANSNQILSSIAQLSPDRDFAHKNEFQRIKWPQLPAPAASDAFTIIADRLRKRSETLIIKRKASPLQKNPKKQPPAIEKTHINLSELYYERRAKLYSSLARITNYSPQYDTVKLYSPSRDDSLTVGVRTITNAIYNNQLIAANPSFSLFEFLNGNRPKSVASHLSFVHWESEVTSFPFNMIGLFHHILEHRKDKYYVASLISYLYYKVFKHLPDQEQETSEYLDFAALVGLCNFASSEEKEDEIKLLAIMTNNLTDYPTQKPTLNIQSILDTHQKEFNAIFALYFPEDTISRESEAKIEQVRLKIENAKQQIQTALQKTKKNIKGHIADISNLMAEEPVIFKKKFKFLSIKEDDDLDSKFNIATIENYCAEYFTNLAKWRLFNLFCETFDKFYPQFTPIPLAPFSRRVKCLIACHTQEIRFRRGAISKKLLELARHVENGGDEVPWIAEGSSRNESTEFPMHINEEDDVEKEFLLDLKQSWNYPAPTMNFDTSKTFCEAFMKKCQALEAKYEQLQQQFLEELKRCLDVDQTITDLIPHSLPFKKELLYAKLLNPNQTDADEYSLVLAVAIIDTMLMKMRRMGKYINAKDNIKLQNEFMQADEVKIWKPRYYPTWLLFEIENNLSIRPIQAKVAIKMINPENNRNSLMQLNMGEGKTAVIAPIVASHLAYKQDSIVRVIVPQHLLPTNYSKMQYQLGRLLNHAVYTIPCSRDRKWNEDNVAIVHNIMTNAIKSRSVMITKPEYIKSFFLKYFEAAVNKQTKLAGLFGEVLNLDLARCRDIIDEADAILHFKSQLIYTLGNQCNIDGSRHRWQAVAVILDCIMAACFNRTNCDRYANEFEKYIQLQVRQGESHIFPKLRFLGEIPDHFSEFLKCTAVDIYLNEKIPSAVSESQKEILRRYICDPNLAAKQLNEFNNMDITAEVRVHALTLRGFMAFNIYLLVLKKRWRVEYGVNTKSKHERAIAVPFRGKDDASENTEFGHPDVATSLTYLSYYYSGLSDHQIETCLLKLDTNEDFTRNSIYSDWVNAIDPAHRLSIPQQFKDINLSDNQQKISLFNIIRKSMIVVQFYLVNIVFPKESKQFDKKIIATACIHAFPKPIRQNVVTGFSGTNDIKLLLPLSIQQNDIPQLLGTNAFVTKNILKNKDYHTLPASIEPNEFVQLLANYVSEDGKKANVLLDVGALVQELSNKELAKKWLALRKDARGVIYYNENNEIVVLSPAGNIKSFCYFNSEDTKDYLVYLDEVHTRGTDIVLPAGYHAIVTLGARLTKDKFVQGCMRMRKLAFEHTLSFWSSFEVHTELLSILAAKSTELTAAPKISSLEIIAWTIRNSVNMIRDGFTLWGSQAINHLHLQSLIESCGHKLPAKKQDRQITNLGELCAVPDAQTLLQIYGGIRNKMTVPEVMSNWGAKYKRHADLQNILQKCSKFVSNVQCYAQLLSEEQERELEAEMEEEMKRDRPPPNKPCKQIVEDELLSFYQAPSQDLMTQLSTNGILLSMKMHFADSTLSKYKFELADPRIVCTREFCNTVQSKKHNSMLRPISWCLIVRSSNRKSILAIILVAPHEADELACCPSNLSSIHKIVPRFTRDQSILIEKKHLSFNYIEFTDGELAALEPLLAQLSILSGSIYFGSAREELFVASYLGLCPAPYSRFENLAVEYKTISSRGFVDPAFRSYSVPGIFSMSQDPIDFLNDLYSIRGIKNLIITDVGKLIHKAKFILNTNNPKKILSVDQDKLLELDEDPNDADEYFDELCKELNLSESDITYLLKFKGDPVKLFTVARKLAKFQTKPK